MPRKTVFAHYIYQSISAHIYDKTRPRYNCWQPVKTTTLETFEAWPCDPNGGIHPDIVRPVEITKEYLGHITRVLVPPSLV